MQTLATVYSILSNNDPIIVPEVVNAVLLILADKTRRPPYCLQKISHRRSSRFNMLNGNCFTPQELAQQVANYCATHNYYIKGKKTSHGVNNSKNIRSSSFSSCSSYFKMFAKADSHKYRATDALAEAEIDSTLYFAKVKLGRGMFACDLPRLVSAWQNEHRVRNINIFLHAMKQRNLYQIYRNTHVKKRIVAYVLPHCGRRDIVENIKEVCIRSTWAKIVNKWETSTLRVAAEARNARSVCWGGKTWVFILKKNTPALLKETVPSNNNSDISVDKCWSSEYYTSILSDYGAGTDFVTAEACRIENLRIGDLIYTGYRGKFRRVQKIWRNYCGEPGNNTEVVQYRGVWMTSHHPVLWGAQWKYPGDLINNASVLPGIDFVREHGPLFNLELDGHIDTVVLSGGFHSPTFTLDHFCHKNTTIPKDDIFARENVPGTFLSCTIGKYLGAEFGWTLWTRRTVPCFQHQIYLEYQKTVNLNKETLNHRRHKEILRDGLTVQNVEITGPNPCSQCKVALVGEEDFCSPSNRWAVFEPFDQVEYTGNLPKDSWHRFSRNDKIDCSLAEPSFENSTIRGIRPSWTFAEEQKLQKWLANGINSKPKASSAYNNDCNFCDDPFCASENTKNYLWSRKNTSTIYAMKNSDDMTNESNTEFREKAKATKLCWRTECRTRLNVLLRSGKCQFSDHGMRSLVNCFDDPELSATKVRKTSMMTIAKQASVEQKNMISQLNFGSKNKLQRDKCSEQNLCQICFCSSKTLNQMPCCHFCCCEKCIKWYCTSKIRSVHYQIHFLNITCPACSKRLNWAEWFPLVSSTSQKLVLQYAVNLLNIHTDKGYCRNERLHCDWSIGKAEHSTISLINESIIFAAFHSTSESKTDGNNSQLNTLGSKNENNSVSIRYKSHPKSSNTPSRRKILHWIKCFTKVGLIEQYLQGIVGVRAFASAIVNAREACFLSPWDIFDELYSLQYLALGKRVTADVPVDKLIGMILALIELNPFIKKPIMKENELSGDVESCIDTGNCHSAFCFKCKRIVKNDIDVLTAHLKNECWEKAKADLDSVTGNHSQCPSCKAIFNTSEFDKDCNNDHAPSNHQQCFLCYCGKFWQQGFNIN